jgi:transposase-like protein
MGKRSRLSVSERVEAVMSLLRREESGAKIARRYGISEPTLYRYRDQFLAAGKTALSSGSGKVDERDRKVERLSKDLAERDQVIGELTIANRILKKTSDGSI